MSPWVPGRHLITKVSKVQDSTGEGDGGDSTHWDEDATKGWPNNVRPAATASWETPQICGEDLAAIGRTMRKLIMIIYIYTWWYMMFQARWWWLWATTAWSQIKSTGKEVVVRTPKLGQNSAGERGASSFSWRKNHWSDKVSGCCLLTKQRSENEHVGMGWSHQPVYTTDTSVYTPVLVAHVSWISWIYQCLVPAISSYEFNLLPHVPQSQNEWNHPPKWKDSGPNNSKSCCVCVPIGSIGTQFIPEFRYVGVLFLLGSSELFF